MSQFGCLKDKLDQRDYLMRAYLPVVKIPKKVDYTKRMSPVRDQGDEGTCVAFASCSGMKEYQEMVDYGKPITLSPRFVYSECKKIDGSPYEGTTLRAAMKVISGKGVCREHFWPYKPHQADKCRAGAAKDAKKFKVLTYARILTLNELRQNLATKGPCIIGVYVYDGMMKTTDGIVPMPERGERTLGGHALCPVGYDDAKQLIKFKNSWTAAWGDKGYGYLPYEYINLYMMDAWSSVDIDDPNPLTLETVMDFVNKGER